MKNVDWSLYKFEDAELDDGCSNFKHETTILSAMFRGTGRIQFTVDDGLNTSQGCKLVLKVPDTSDEILRSCMTVQFQEAMMKRERSLSYLWQI